MKTIIPSYRPYGQPASGYIDLIRIPVAGEKVTIDGIDYIFGTDFFGTGRTVFAICQAMAEAIRGEPNNEGHAVRNPIATTTAIAYGSLNGVASARLVLIATNPGAGGNAITLTTNAPTCFVVSGATLTGGSSASASAATSNSNLPYGADYAGYTLNGDGNPIVILFKRGGAGGTTLKTRTIHYSGTNIDSITDT